MSPGLSPLQRLRLSLAQVAPPPGTYPWQDADAFIVLVSEMLLARTRRSVVSRVMEPFIERWPDAEAVAAADPEELAEIIKPTGFARRVGLIQEAARRIVEEHGGRVPMDRDRLLTLPGVGPYTADAVLNLCGEACRMPMDRNTDRVLSRLLGREPSPEVPYKDEEVARFGDALLAAAERPSAVFRGLLEVSASVCRPKEPDCDVCPVVQLCATAAGRVERSSASAARATA